MDAHLYTVTSNSVLRVYSTVLDDPSWFQLLFSLDKYAFSRSEPSLKGKEPASVTGVLWVIDAYVLRLGVAAEIVRVEESGERVPAESMKVMEALAAEECDVVAWFGSDGHLSLRSILVRLWPLWHSVALRCIEHGQKAAHTYQVALIGQIPTGFRVSSGTCLGFRRSTFICP